MDSVREGVGITVSYWTDPDAIKLWKQQAEHRMAQSLGKQRWYANYDIKIARVEHAYQFVSDSV